MQQMSAAQQQRRSVITRLLSGGLATDYCVHQSARDTLQQDVGVDVARVTAQAISKIRHGAVQPA